MEYTNTLRVGVFFDGTGNNQDNAATRPDQSDRPALGSYANARSNVALLHALYPSGLVQGCVYFKCYVQGVGTVEGEADSWFSQATGRGPHGVMARVSEALQHIAGVLREYRAGQAQSEDATLVFDLFGFSRGAAAARHLANLLTQSAARLPMELEGARIIHFIGLFDTVAAIVAPLSANFDPANTRYAGLRLGLRDGLARHQVQLVAANERRRNFPLLRSGNDIVMPGVHSDIGGGYLESMREQVLLTKPRANRVAQATPAERTAVYREALALLESNFAQLEHPRPAVLTWERPLAPSPERWEVAQKEVFAAVYREREVSGHLSRVYLSIMRELAVRAGVPFAALGQDPAHRLPQELLPISRKLHAQALGEHSAVPLTEAEHALLRRRYLHTSAHWNTPLGMRDSALEALYIDRPGEAGRIIHDNPVG
ncbi:MULTISPECIES: T6SS phospholipase effector Tle1-like catalytic domain-containing protein [Pseudomonas]|uniref:DUF2235 domain-containing protein n=1 Tax=Pseudomonas mosselii TaxID=78327 RepID=A0A5R8YTL9_9PSED|nr:DUF2235 domain-containing protein [Pseudomonas mosselii]TLP56733.1 DUF2235 domain-containing protein [Pseudomonas mosselii]